MGMDNNKDNIMRDMAREVNLLNDDVKREKEQPISPAKKKAGVIAFWCLLALLVAIIMLFVIL